MDLVAMTTFLNLSVDEFVNLLLFAASSAPHGLHGHKSLRDGENMIVVATEMLLRFSLAVRSCFSCW